MESLINPKNIYSALLIVSILSVSYGIYLLNKNLEVILAKNFKIGFKYFVIKCLVSLEKQQKIFFAIYYQGNYATQKYLIENNIQLVNLNFFKNIRLAQLYNSNKYFPLTNNLNELFPLLVSLGALRYQIDDHSMLEIFQEEFKKISFELSKIFKAIIKKQDFNVESIMLEIKKIESIFMSTIGIAIKEPSKFIIWIANLKNLIAKLTNVANEFKIS